MFNKFLKKSGKTNRSLKEDSVKEKAVFSEMLDDTRCLIKVKWSQIPSYMEERLLKLHKNYSDLISIIQYNSDVEVREKATETAERMWHQHVYEEDSSEIKVLILDQSKRGLIKALTYLDDRVLKSLEHYKRTGELVSGDIWRPAGGLVVNLDKPLTSDVVDQMGKMNGK
jgi:hypothetical protein